MITQQNPVLKYCSNFKSKYSHITPHQTSLNSFDYLELIAILSDLDRVTEWQCDSETVVLFITMKTCWLARLVLYISHVCHHSLYRVATFHANIQSICSQEMPSLGDTNNHQPWDLSRPSLQDLHHGFRFVKISRLKVTDINLSGTNWQQQKSVGRPSQSN